MSGRANHEDMKIIMEVINYDANLPTIVVRLDSEVYRIDNKVGEEL